MITLVYNLCANVQELSVYIGSFITLAIDIVASIILLVKAIKAKNVTLKDAFAGIIKIFSRKKKEDAEEIADEIADEIESEKSEKSEKESDDNV